LSNSKVDEYLKKGIYGPKETKPEERRRFLSSLRERVVLALTTLQVMENEVYPQVEMEMKKNAGVQLLLNGHIDYSHLSKYISLTKKAGIPYTIVTNKDYQSDIGLVLASEKAIEKEEIFVNKIAAKPEQKQTEKENEKDFFSTLQNIFKKQS
jgi:uncharacterized protein YueI